MKNKKLIIIIILLIILGSIYPIYYIIKKNQKIENKIYYYELKNNSLTLLANGKIVTNVLYTKITLTMVKFFYKKIIKYIYMI